MAYYSRSFVRDEVVAKKKKATEIVIYSLLLVPLTHYLKKVKFVEKLLVLWPGYLGFFFGNVRVLEERQWLFNNFISTIGWI